MTRKAKVLVSALIFVFVATLSVINSDVSLMDIGDAFSLPSGWPWQVYDSQTYTRGTVSEPTLTTKETENSYPKTYAIQLSQDPANHYTNGLMSILARYDIAEIQFDGIFVDTGGDLAGTPAPEAIKSRSSVNTVLWGRTMFKSGDETGWKWNGTGFEAGVIAVAPTATPGTRTTATPSCSNTDFFCNRRAQEYAAYAEDLSDVSNTRWVIENPQSTPVFRSSKFPYAANNLYSGSGANTNANGETFAEFMCRRIHGLMNVDNADGTLGFDGIRDDVGVIHQHSYLRTEDSDADEDGTTDATQWGGTLGSTQGERDMDSVVNFGMFDLYNCLRNNGVRVWGNGGWEPDIINIGNNNWVYQGKENLDGYMLELVDSTASGWIGYFQPWGGGHAVCGFACMQKVMQDWNDDGKSGVILGGGHSDNSGWFDASLQPEWSTDEEALRDYYWAMSLMQNAFYGFQDSYTTVEWKPDYWVAYNDAQSKCESTTSSSGAKWLGAALDEGTNGDGTTLDSIIKSNSWTNANNQAWIRRFEWGVAVVNPTTSTRFVNLPESTHVYKLVDGTSDVNSGGVVQIPAHRGMVLCDITQMDGGTPPDPPVPPTVPNVTGLTATTNLPNQIDVSWNSAGTRPSDSDFYKYDLVRTTSNVSSDPANEQNFNLLCNECYNTYSFIDSTANINTNYYYWVRAVDDSIPQNGAWSAAVLGERPATPTPTPTHTPTPVGCIDYQLTAAYDGELIKTGNGSWSSLRDATTATSVDTTSNLGRATTKKGTGTNWVEISRLGFTFDTSAVPDTHTTMSNAAFRIYINNFAWPSDIDIVPFTPANTRSYAVGDYDAFGAATYGQLYDSQQVINTWFDISLNDASWISETGDSTLGMMLYADHADVEYTGLNDNHDAYAEIGMSEAPADIELHFRACQPSGDPDTPTPTATNTPTRIPPLSCGHWYYSDSASPPPYANCVQGGTISGYNYSTSGDFEWYVERQASNSRVPPVGNAQYWYYCAPEGTILEISGKGWSQNYEGGEAVGLTSGVDVLSGNTTYGSYTDTCDGNAAESKHLISEVFQGILDLADTYILNGFMANKSTNACEMQPFIRQEYDISVVECGWSQATPINTGTPVPGGGSTVTVTPQLVWPPASTPVPPPTATATNTPPPVPTDVFFLESGVPHLFLDDGYYEETTSTNNYYPTPVKLGTNPIVFGSGDCDVDGVPDLTQPFLTVKKEGNLYRMWRSGYGDGTDTDDTNPPEWVGGGAGYVTSTNPLSWGCWQNLDSFNTTTGQMIAENPSGYVGMSHMFRKKYARVTPTPPTADSDYFVMRLNESFDGITWDERTSYFYSGTPTAVEHLIPLGGLGGGVDNLNDIPYVDYDPWNGWYEITHRVYENYSWTNLEGTPNPSNERIRRTGIFTSTNGINWSESQILFAPDSSDPGVTQFYGGPHGIRIIGNDLRLGFLKMLDESVVRPGADNGCIPTGTVGPPWDNWPCDQGYGWTALTWQRPGGDWYRSRQKFIDASSNTEDFDHAHAWASTMVDINADTTYIYYGGYEEGHKNTPRLAGIAEMKKNRFVGKTTGTVTTDKVMFNADKLYVNYDSDGLDLASGNLDIRIRNEANTATLLSCTGWSSVDDVKIEVTCPGLTDYNMVAVRLQFEMTNGGYLYGFEFSESADPPFTPTPTPAAGTPTPTWTATPTATHTPTTTPTPTITPSPEVIALSLNEISLNRVDANRNGILETIEDQCIELFNPTTQVIPMLGWSLWDDNQEIYRFISGSAFPGKVLAVWGSQLGSIITGRTIELKDPNGNIVNTALPNYQSDVLARTPNGALSMSWLSGLENSTCGFNNPNP